MAANLKDIFNEVEEVLNENQLKRDSIREASKILENQVIQVVQVTITMQFKPKSIRSDYTTGSSRRRQRFCYFRS